MRTIVTIAIVRPGQKQRHGRADQKIYLNERHLSGPEGATEHWAADPLKLADEIPLKGYLFHSSTRLRSIMKAFASESLIRNQRSIL